MKDLKCKSMKQLFQQAIRPFYFVLFAVLLYSCNVGSIHTGIIKNAGTGLTAVYKDLVPTDVFLLANNEELNNNEIPLGEPFILVNNHTKGFVEKDGKVSFGCSLIIKDEAGTELMNEPDLFKGEDILQASPTTVLRCTVNTGSPMKEGQKYQVAVRFWDKYGKGQIENTVTIKIIGHP